MSDIQNSGIVIVPDATTGAGSVCWWRLAGGVALDALARAWADEGLDSTWLPDAPSREVILRRTVAALRERRRLVRPLEGSKGWAIVVESAQGDDLGYEIAARVRQNGVGVEIDPPDGEVASEIRVEYQRQIGVLDVNDVSAHLCRTLDRCDALALRANGGVYFVPAHGTDTWRRAARATAKASESRIYEVPALKTAEAVEAILDAVAAEAETIAAGVEADLSDEEGLGLRAIRTRQGKLVALAEKLARYESLCGKGVQGIAPRLATLQAALTAAVLSAQAEADAEADAATGAV